MTKNVGIILNNYEGVEPLVNASQWVNNTKCGVAMLQLKLINNYNIYMTAMSQHNIWHLYPLKVGLQSVVDPQVDKLQRQYPINN